MPGKLSPLKTINLKSFPQPDIDNPVPFQSISTILQFLFQQKTCTKGTGRNAERLQTLAIVKRRAEVVGIDNIQ